MHHELKINLKNKVNNGARMVRRGWYGMTLLGNDVLVCGGENEKGYYVSSCALYNASTNEWATIQQLPVAMSQFSMITLQTRPYVFGGTTISSILNTVYTFDTSKAWTTRTPMKQAVASHTAVAVDTNTALVCGGTNGSAAQSACFNYAATENIWSPAAQMITPRIGHGMVVYKGLVVAVHDLHNW
jgi:N-acetylneuraminic acid mutarotase